MDHSGWNSLYTHISSGLKHFPSGKRLCGRNSLKTTSAATFSLCSPSTWTGQLYAFSAEHCVYSFIAEYHFTLVGSHSTVKGDPSNNSSCTWYSIFQCHSVFCAASTYYYLLKHGNWILSISFYVLFVCRFKSCAGFTSIFETFCLSFCADKSINGLSWLTAELRVVSAEFCRGSETRI